MTITIKQAKDLLLQIGVTNIDELNITDCKIIYKNAVETSYQLFTYNSELDFRIIKLSDEVYSKIDFVGSDFKFKRNVNLLTPLFNKEKDITMPIKELRILLGDTQEQFALRYNIPKRTIENWESGKRTPPTYMIQLLTRVVKEDSKEGA